MLLTPGLYKIERAVLLLYLIATPVLFITGAAVVYYCIFLLASRPCSHQFMLAFGAAFQIPVILTLMVRVRLLVIASLVFVTARLNTSNNLLNRLGVNEKIGLTNTLLFLSSPLAL
ncbi:Sec-independent protein translocase protein TatC [Dirofilaria immitis]|nr:Sec-independent protein translocase protein TatC [Dirofilaria immitis]